MHISEYLDVDVCSCGVYDHIQLIVALVPSLSESHERTWTQRLVQHPLCLARMTHPFYKGTRVIVDGVTEGVVDIAWFSHTTRDYSYTIGDNDIEQHRVTLADQTKTNMTVKVGDRVIVTDRFWQRHGEIGTVINVDDGFVCIAFGDESMHQMYPIKDVKIASDEKDLKTELLENACKRALVDLKVYRVLPSATNGSFLAVYRTRIPTCECHLITQANTRHALFTKIVDSHSLEILEALVSENDRLTKALCSPENVTNALLNGTDLLNE